MARCGCCNSTKAELAWQPFGPDESAPRGGLSLAGSHYRGFPVVPLCYSCQGYIKAGDTVRFTLNRQHYRLEGDTLSKEA